MEKRMKECLLVAAALGGAWLHGAELSVVLFRDCTFGAQCPQIREVDERFPLEDVRFENCRYAPLERSSYSHLRELIPQSSAKQAVLRRDGAVKP